MTSAFVALQELVDAVADKEGLAKKITGPMYTERLKEKMDQARAVLQGPPAAVAHIKADLILEARKDLDQYLDARNSGDHLANFKMESISLLLSEYPEPKAVSLYLRERWLELRDDRTLPHQKLLAAVRGFHAVGLLTDEQQELWRLRTNTCPGHDDEGGRRWCAYCGDIKLPE